MPTPCKSVSAVTVGGVEVTAEEVAEAIRILRSARGIMVRQPLAKANHRLADADYHAVPNEQRELDGDKKVQTKVAFVAALRRLSAG